MAVDPTDPVALYQAHIDVLSDALLRADAETFISRMSYPNVMVCDGGTTVIKDGAHERAILAEYFETLRMQRVTAFIRLCTEAEFITPDRIEGTHISHMMSSGHRLNKPYPNRLRLERINGHWLETASANALRRAGGIMSLPIVADDPKIPQLPKFDPERITHD
ncbi:hypothetical protein L0664_15690 [Octadecabacter sp. G9-8]|uniref:SnoaL-like domain-containing protein n=1 Tax=Octadecabacter dasysiphoniae TaxID=2909341 RepID=A0ABS9CZC1_9RHOB|nr:hypothetical protein [Octadecabacter dasysiphoniae]MCF2872518.1 hypothetical protein [Octadecabacter dasysiphoniae]